MFVIMRCGWVTNIKRYFVCKQVGGTEEYVICDALKSGRLFKPLVAWCIGTCANMFTSEVQFGHAGASANSERETAVAKNKVSEYLDMYGYLLCTSHTHNARAFISTHNGIHVHSHAYPRTHTYVNAQTCMHM